MAFKNRQEILPPNEDLEKAKTDLNSVYLLIKEAKDELERLESVKANQKDFSNEVKKLDKNIKDKKDKIYLLEMDIEKQIKDNSIEKNVLNKKYLILDQNNSDLTQKNNKLDKEFVTKKLELKKANEMLLKTKSTNDKLLEDIKSNKNVFSKNIADYKTEKSKIEGEIKKNKSFTSDQNNNIKILSKNINLYKDKENLIKSKISDLESEHSQKRLSFELEIKDIKKAILDLDFCRDKIEKDNEDKITRIENREKDIAVKEIYTDKLIEKLKMYKQEIEETSGKRLPDLIL